jgi:hypothetical protein
MVAANAGRYVTATVAARRRRKSRGRGMTIVKATKRVRWIDATTAIDAMNAIDAKNTRLTTSITATQVATTRAPTTTKKRSLATGIRRLRAATTTTLPWRSSHLQKKRRSLNATLSSLRKRRLRRASTMPSFLAKGTKNVVESESSDDDAFLASCSKSLKDDPLDFN